MEKKLLNLDHELLSAFEGQLNPNRLESSSFSVSILGFGEISAILKIGNDEAVAYKRMPIFDDILSAEQYVAHFNEYCGLLEEAGLKLPQHETSIIQIPKRPVVCYIAQRQFPAEMFGHKLIQSTDEKGIRDLIRQVAIEISKVFIFNRAKAPFVEIALDGQISNWVREEGRDNSVLYIDTSTPLYKKGRVEQLDPELFLKSAPSFLRWIIRLFFLKGVMERYYDQRRVYLDLAANLLKEQRPDLLPVAIEIINEYLYGKMKTLTLENVVSYYRGDKLIWRVFLAFRKIDRFIKTRIARKRYEFILPERIKR